LFKGGGVVLVWYVGGFVASGPLPTCFTKRVPESVASTVGPPGRIPAAGALLEALRMDGNQGELSGVPEFET